MSCNTKTSLAAVIDAVNAQLNNNYVDRDDPRIDQGVFTEPTIRGGLMLDEAAKLDFCGYVTECGQREPFGKQWVDRPLYPYNTLVSYEDEGEIKSRWQDIDDVVAGTEIGESYTTYEETRSLGLQGYTIIDSFELGATITQRDQALRHAATGKLYRWAGDLPKIVPADSTPVSSGGVDTNAWLEVSDTALRQEILTGGLITDTIVTVTANNGTSPRTLVDRNKEIVFIDDFSRLDGEVDDTQRLQRFFDYCRVNEKQGILNKKITVSDTVYCDCDFDGTKGFIDFYGDKPALVVSKHGEDNGRVYGRRIIFPEISNLSKTDVGWGQVANSIGIQLINPMESEFNVPTVHNFGVGLHHYGRYSDANYNIFTIGKLVNNKINLLIEADGTVTKASVNQNTYIGGRYAHFSSEQEGGVNRVVGSRHIHAVVKGENSSSLNNNVFINPSIEGLVDEYALLFENTGSTNGVSYNTVLSARIETSKPEFKKLTFKGNRVRWNSLVNGYGISANAIEEIDGAGSNSVQSQHSTSSMTGSPGTTYPVLALRNASSGSAPSLAIFSSTATDITDIGQAGVKLGAGGITLGLSNSERFKIGSYGQLSWLNGGTVNCSMTYAGSKKIRLDAGFYADNIGVANITDIVEPIVIAEAPTKKLPIYDADGALQGYIPIYDSL